MNKDLVMIFPPFWDYYSPFLSLPTLVGYLKDKGFNVTQFDLNIKHFNKILKNKSKYYIELFKQKDFYDNSLGQIYKAVFKTNSFENCLESMSFLNGVENISEEYKSNFYKWNTHQLNITDSLIHYIFFNQFFGKNFKKQIKELEIDEILNSLDTEALSETFLESDIKNLVKDFSPLIGFSTVCFDQFIVSCLYAKIIKSINPKIKIIFGGSYIPVFLQICNPEKITKIFEFTDFLGYGEGETALEKLILYCKGEDILIDSIPNICFKNKDNEFVKTNLYLENSSNMPIPNYDDLELTSYLMPEVMLSYQSSRGCFWGHCVFCDHEKNYRFNFRTKTPEKIVNEIHELKTKYNINHLQLVDEAIKPDIFKEIVYEMDKYSLFKDFNWFYYSRISNFYTNDVLIKASENGCRMVMFGVETFNKRLLKMIMKGTSEDNIKENIKLFKKNNIKVSAWMICGFPSQTIEDVYYDIKNLDELGCVLNGVFAGLFRLESTCDIFENIEGNNILGYDENDPYFFTSHYKGEIIDQKKIHKIYWEEYLPIVSNISTSHNRYIIYFRDKPEYIRDNKLISKVEEFSKEEINQAIWKF